MRSLTSALTLLLVVPGIYCQQAAVHTLTIQVENVNKDDGNIGVLVFNSNNGWPEDRFAALKDIVVPAHPGTVTVMIPGLPAGDYAVAIAHDVNKNHRTTKWIKTSWACRRSSGECRTTRTQLLKRRRSTPPNS